MTSKVKQGNSVSLTAAASKVSNLEPVTVSPTYEVFSNRSNTFHFCLIIILRITAEIKMLFVRKKTAVSLFIAV